MVDYIHDQSLDRHCVANRIIQVVEDRYSFGIGQ